MTDGSDKVGRAVHAAWVKHDVAQCSYCQSGQIMSATAFLKSGVAYVVEASVKDGTPTLHGVTAGVHCNLAVNPQSVEAQVQGAALMGLSMCLPGAATTLKDGVVEQGNSSDFAVPRITDMPKIAVHIVPSADAPTGMGEPGLPALAPAFANAVASLTGKPLRELQFKLA